MIENDELERVKQILSPNKFKELLISNEYELWIEISEEINLNEFAEKVTKHIFATITVEKEFDLWISQEKLDKRRKYKILPSNG